MFSLRKTLVSFLILTAFSSFLAYKIIDLGYDNMYEAQALGISE
ncbi:MAG TPA: hypothetical protein VLB02_02730 [Candidatus Paceibacterota bacterium]|nr:hypothetical protein [Candidatus Paceibacterota bacterium]